MRRGGTRGFPWTTEQDGNAEQGKRRRTVSGSPERGTWNGEERWEGFMGSRGSVQGGFGGAGRGVCRSGQEGCGGRGPVRVGTAEKRVHSSPLAKVGSAAGVPEWFG